MGIIQPAGANVQHHIANLVIKFERAMSFTYLCIGNLSGFGSFGEIGLQPLSLPSFTIMACNQKAIKSLRLCQK